MCGRYQLTRKSQHKLQTYYNIDSIQCLKNWEREYNIPPRTVAPIITQQDIQRMFHLGFWSMLHPRSKNLNDATKYSTFNARIETVHQKSTFKEAVKKRRCIIPAEGFFEWIGPKGRKHPLHIRKKNQSFLSMAGLFNLFIPPDSNGQAIYTFTILTTKSSQWMARIHNRMPLILSDQQIDLWLSSFSSLSEINQLLSYSPSPEFECNPVDGRILNSGIIDTPECIVNTEPPLNSLFIQ